MSIVKGKRRTAWALSVVCSTLLLAGCVGAEAESVGKTSKEPTFSPCDDIPDDVIQQIGMDLATKDRDIMDVHQPGWNICGWDKGDDSLSVYSTVYTLDDLRRNSDFTDFSPASVPGRDAVAFRSADTAASIRSYVAVGTGEGMVMLAFSDWSEHPSGRSPSDRALAAMTAFTPYLPK